MSEELGDQDTGSKRRGQWHGPCLIAHKPQTLVGPLHGKRIRLDGGVEEKDPGEDEGGGGMWVRHAVSILSCPILTCPF